MPFHQWWPRSSLAASNGMFSRPAVHHGVWCAYRTMRSVYFAGKKLHPSHIQLPIPDKGGPVDRASRAYSAISGMYEATDWDHWMREHVCLFSSSLQCFQHKGISPCILHDWARAVARGSSRMPFPPGKSMDAPCRFEWLSSLATPALHVVAAMQGRTNWV